jgi:NifU-like protein involved in Fe-S cluster formation
VKVAPANNAIAAIGVKFGGCGTILEAAAMTINVVNAQKRNIRCSSFSAR